MLFQLNIKITAFVLIVLKFKINIIYDSNFNLFCVDTTSNNLKNLNVATSSKIQSTFEQLNKSQVFNSNKHKSEKKLIDTQAPDINIGLLSSKTSNKPRNLNKSTLNAAKTSLP